MAVADVDILLQCLRVPQRGLDFAMAQEPLDLFERHTALEGQAGGSVPEYMRRDVAVDVAPLQDLLNFVLHGLDRQPIMRSSTSNKQGRGIVAPGIQIRTEGDLSFGIKERCATLAAFPAFDVNGVVLPVDVRLVQRTELTDAAR